MTTTVVIAIDDAGMLGGASEEDIAVLDVEETYSKYLDMFESKIKEHYPDVTVERKIGPTTYSTKVYSDELDLTEIEEMTDHIQDMGGDIYEKGEFWTNKNF